MRTKLIIFFLMFGMLVTPLRPVLAAPSADVKNDKVTFSFPETATFSASLSAAADIVSVVLEYGDVRQTCGEVIAKAYPMFAPGKSVDVEWVWDMRQSGSLPPGASIWWHWRYTDANGKEYVTDTMNATWLDDVHKWQTITSDFLRLHWYKGDQAFAKDLLNAAVNGLEFNKTESGLTPENTIDIYIYADTQDLKDAVLYEPAWTGGEAFPDQDIVIIGISQADLDWGRDAMVHELTHVLVGHLTFSCLGDVPTWLNEGLAVFSEGPLDKSSQSQLDQAVEDDSLLSVRSISNGFSEISDKANLSYAESYSIVNFLIETYKQDKMTSLLTALRDGKTIDDALVSVYGFDIEGLEDAWRDSIGASPRAASAQPTAMPTPTWVPTIVPVSGAPAAVTPTPYAIPTSTISGEQQPPATRTAPPIWLTLFLLLFCCLTILVIGVFAIGLIVRSQNQKARKNG